MKMASLFREAIFLITIELETDSFLKIKGSCEKQNGWD